MSPSINQAVKSLGRDLQKGDELVSNKDSHEGLCPSFPVFEVINPHIPRRNLFGRVSDCTKVVRYFGGGESATLFIPRDKDCISQILPHKER